MTLIDKSKTIKIELVEVSESYTVSKRIDYNTCIKRSRTENTNPINHYIKSTKQISKLSNPADYDYEIANLLVLAHVSRVEDYFRTLIRQLVFIDPLTRDYFSAKELPFAAAETMSLRMMPEAVIEKYNFIDEESIAKALKDLIGFSGQLPKHLADIIDDFEKIMNLRHCIIHRAGRFGAKNAIKFGYSAFANRIDGQIRIDYSQSQLIYEHLDVFVRSMNTFMFSYIVSRLVLYGIFTKNYSTDKALFEKVYNLFIVNPTSLAMHKAYIKYSKIK